MEAAGIGITGVAQVHVTVADLDRALGFYRSVLGLPLLVHVPEQGMAFLGAGGTRVYLGPAEGVAPTRPLVYYGVPSVREAHRRLEARGVPVEAGPHVVHRAGGLATWLAFLRDPDGNPVGLLSEEPDGPV